MRAVMLGYWVILVGVILDIIGTIWDVIEPLTDEKALGGLLTPEILKFLGIVIVILPVVCWSGRSCTVAARKGSLWDRIEVYFREVSKPISSDLGSHIPLQQTTATAVCSAVEPQHHEDTGARARDLLGKKYARQCMWVNNSAKPLWR